MTKRKRIKDLIKLYYIVMYFLKFHRNLKSTLTVTRPIGKQLYQQYHHSSYIFSYKYNQFYKFFLYRQFILIFYVLTCVKFARNIQNYYHLVLLQHMKQSSLYPIHFDDFCYYCFCYCGNCCKINSFFNFSFLIFSAFFLSFYLKQNKKMSLYMIVSVI